ncbi:MAG: tRNA lysidine(34) synthetase TilS [Clostridia bacterium]|nr:tRNA lysidine(34) synthetase TilS [Clostridia bacterium]
MKAEAILQKVRYDLPETGKIVVGLSGGADSTLLTYLLLQKYGAERLCCVHVNHGIRGEEADRDEDFVRAFCAFHSLHLEVLKKDVPALAKESGEGIEECARRVRYEAFAAFAGETGSIATAHNADDNAETVLLNLTRGMGPRGACGIPAKRGSICRPLLGVSRAEIEFLCAEFGLSFVTDSTNSDTAYTRNRLRHNVLPELKEINPRLTDAVGHFTDTMALQQDFMRQEAEKLLKNAETAWGWRLSVLREAHPAVLRAALEILLHAVGRLSYEHLLEAERCVRLGGGVSLPGHAQLTAKQDTLTVTCGAQEAYCIPLTGNRTRLPDGRVLLVSKKFTENGKNSGKVHNLLFNNFPDCDRITSTAVVRTRRSGDRFRPAGRGVGKSLKKLFNELSIPAAVRDRLWLLEADGEIIWIESVGAADGWSGLLIELAAEQGENTPEGKGQ